MALENGARRVSVKEFLNLLAELRIRKSFWPSAGGFRVASRLGKRRTE